MHIFGTHLHLGAAYKVIGIGIEVYVYAIKFTERVIVFDVIEASASASANYHASAACGTVLTKVKALNVKHFVIIHGV